MKFLRFSSYLCWQSFAEDLQKHVRGGWRIAYEQITQSELGFIVDYIVRLEKREGIYVNQSMLASALAEAEDYVSDFRSVEESEESSEEWIFLAKRAFYLARSVIEINESLQEVKNE